MKMLGPTSMDHEIAIKILINTDTQCKFKDEAINKASMGHERYLRLIHES